MTTDRPTSTRTTALPQRAYASAAPAGRQPAAPTDAFSALLGAAAPRTDDAPRSDAPRQRRDDAQRPQRNDARDAQRPQRSDDSQPKAKPAAKPADEQPKADAPAQEPTTEEPTEGAPRPMTPDIFALQLASPLPPTPVAATPTGAPVPAAAATAEGEATTVAIPAFPALNLLNGIAPAQPGTEATTAEAPTQGATAAAPGGIPLPFLAGLATEAQTDLPTIELPAELPTADAAAPQLDATTVAPNAGGEQPSQDSSQQQPNPQAAANATAQASKPADAPAPAATTQPLTQAAPVAQSVATPAPTALQRAIPLYRAPESAAQLIQMAADRGITHAKLNLKPVELGGIEVRLQSTPHGVTAQLVADSAEAAKLLTHAADDLRRDLADRNVNLLSLDVSTQQQYQEQQQAGSRQADIFGDNHNPGGVQNLRFGPQGDAGLTETAAPADTSLVLPNGVHVDVLA
ncbi:flagellar hook-length control protein FliK [Solirubrobacter taibaiensis]|nr:flagellar hook-length control protein FliK [Solirubrobacter taibaiensis]